MGFDRTSPDSVSSDGSVTNRVVSKSDANGIAKAGAKMVMMAVSCAKLLLDAKKEGVEGLAYSIMFIFACSYFWMQRRKESKD
ncbi:hypothetical protein L1987_69054 [Smallanthus sonchifolius]|uniref:Uncharacterized protein n=1 Tax=Smallanthus sonchifolius TaxID=185202 RepID=A0ACB9B5F4_9ASTR|nr:hypothetical protein L1987_69054 [Smallanthus sonchifolius]